jgi:hypothetical protein
MPDLETLLKDVRPAPRPEWTARMDAKVAARFPGPVPAHRRWLRALREHFAALSLATATAAALFLVVIVVATNVDGGDNYASSGGSGSTAASESSSGASTAKSAAPLAAPAPGATRDSAGAGKRAVIASASLTLTTGSADVESVTDRAIRITDTLGGYVENSTSSREGLRATATLTLKLPSDKLDDGIAQISKLAHVQSRAQDSQDVTDQRSVLEGAVRDARADRDGLRARLAKATTDKERSRLRALLDRASRRVTQRERAVASLNQEVSYSTVVLEVRGTRKSGAAGAADDRWTPGDALKDAGRVLEVVAGVLVIGLAILLPIAILAALAAYANRGLTRRRRERTLEAS